ncbi:early activation antigen CD69-like [Microcaecilia unicolor]|uniref:Early activation antigen CD69-like n=1 Tax=Microcaecilia unicolor TaxID=1415580 RepID=A0A6P7WRZ7_9AMPH|nr:early activation antigen CD69-like [Microcaecilia unicolor]
MSEAPLVVTKVFTKDNSDTSRSNACPTDLITSISTADPAGLAAKSCQHGWISFRQKKCFLVSNTESDWNSSRSDCDSRGASLALIESREELEFLEKRLDNDEYRLGLRRDNSSGPWIWINGTKHDNSVFAVEGQSLCAYLDKNKVRSVRCETGMRWICSMEPASQKTGLDPAGISGKDF